MITIEKLASGLYLEFNKVYNSIKDIKISNICYNSRTVYEGCLFAALVGETVDGHNYVQDAYNRGCRVFLVERDVNLPDDAIIIYADNTRQKLSYMSANFFGNPTNDLTIIGVTGTKGKTTITNYISSVLNSVGISTGVIGTNGAFYDGICEKTVNTTPESYELQRIFRNMVNAGVKVVAMEVSSGGIMMDRVCGINFDIALFSNISPDHIGPKEHDSFEDYLECKSRLFEMSKFAVVNSDADYYKYILDKCTCEAVTYSINNPSSNFRASNISFLSSLSDSLDTEFTCTVNNSNSLSARICSPGIFSIYNALAVIAVCTKLGVKSDDILNALKTSKVNGRVQVVPALPYCKIIIDYAHNSASLESILNTLKAYNPNRLICLFGSVGGRTKLRRKDLGDIASRECDIAILTSDNPDFEEPLDIIKDIEKSFVGSECEYIIEPDREKAIFKAINIAKEGDIILLAGKGHEDYQLIKGEKIPFKEEEIIHRAAKEVLFKNSVLELSL